MMQFLLKSAQKPIILNLNLNLYMKHHASNYIFGVEVQGGIFIEK